MTALEFFLYPLILPMTFVLEVLQRLFGSYGAAIVGTSATVRLATYPLSWAAARMEQRERLIQAAMAPAVAMARAKYTGRERFEAIEVIYREYNYHPIKSLASLVPLFLQIPFLLSALFLLVDHPPLVSEPFLIISNLSQPDGLLMLGEMPINILPIGVTMIAVTDSLLNPLSTRQSQMRFSIIAAVLLILIYPLPAAVCLYWMSSNLWSLLGSLLSRIQKEALLRGKGL